MTNGHDTAQVRLKEQPAKLSNISRKLEDIGEIARAISGADREKVTCAFSSVMNSTLEQRTGIKNIINVIARKMDDTSAYGDEEIFRIADKRADLQRIDDELFDFINLMDCTIEGTPNNPRIFASHFGRSLFAFADRTRMLSDELLKVM